LLQGYIQTAVFVSQSRSQRRPSPALARRCKCAQHPAGGAGFTRTVPPTRFAATL